MDVMIHQTCISNSLYRQRVHIIQTRKPRSDLTHSLSWWQIIKYSILYCVVVVKALLYHDGLLCLLYNFCLHVLHYFDQMSYSFFYYQYAIYFNNHL